LRLDETKRTNLQFDEAQPASMTQDKSNADLTDLTDLADGAD
jgi:hypothetical protein